MGLDQALNNLGAFEMSHSASEKFQKSVFARRRSPVEYHGAAEQLQRKRQRAVGEDEARDEPLHELQHRLGHGRPIEHVRVEFLHLKYKRTQGMSRAE